MCQQHELVLAGRNAFVLFKQSNEVIAIVEARSIRHLSNVVAGIAQEFFGFFDAFFQYKFNGTHAQFALEAAVKRSGAHAGLGTQLLEAQVFV